MRKLLLRLSAAGYVAAIAALVSVAVVNREANVPRSVEHNIPSALSKKLARSARFAPADASDRLDSPDSWAAQDWLEHSIDGASNDPPAFTAFATARNDWFGLLGRPAFGTGKWVPFGPTNGQNDLTNVFRDRTVYTTGTENFGGTIVKDVNDVAPEVVPLQRIAFCDQTDILSGTIAD